MIVIGVFTPTKGPTIDKNKAQGYFKYNSKTKSVDFYEKNIKNKEMER